MYIYIYLSTYSYYTIYVCTYISRPGFPPPATDDPVAKSLAIVDLSMFSRYLASALRVWFIVMFGL